MSLRFTIESSPSPQAETERVFTGGLLSIGRSADADWQLDDPNAFISRRHCVISEEDGQVVVTDASSGGLYIDNSAHAVGLGNKVVVTPGMRLYMGDFTVRVEAVSGTSASPPTPSAAPVGRSFFPEEDPSTAPIPPEPAPERPANLPDPFGLRTDASQGSRHKELERKPRPLDQADPFGLDLRRSAVEEPGQPKGGHGAGSAASSYFSDAPAETEPKAEPPAQTPPAPSNDIFGDWRVDAPQEPAPPQIPPLASVRTSPAFADDGPKPVATETASVSSPVDPYAQTKAETSAPQRPDRTVPHDEEDLRDALFRGMGIDPAQMATDDPIAELEHLGRCMRNLVEGVMLLLRTRAQEKQKVRVAQTIIASADVNPLKFLATPEDALSALIRPRGSGYMSPDAAVDGAFRDLADHQVRTWSALQVALRRMVDKFDPAEIEKEMENVGLLESIVAGGRSAKLWQIYEDRYRDIAETAEKQFLGDVGVDFRDAYENRRTD